MAAPINRGLSVALCPVRLAALTSSLVEVCGRSTLRSPRVTNAKRATITRRLIDPEHPREPIFNEVTGHGRREAKAEAPRRGGHRSRRGVRHRTVSHERALAVGGCPAAPAQHLDRKSTRLNSSHSQISYA